ncbi:MAG TPA: PAS domain-containing protein [Alphaproteobacteria bacterium]|nr:PAS domain-containing protein [Alphaproteobacteria bacterium]
MERRLVLRLLKYWRGLGDVEKFPSESAIDARVIADMWPHCVMLDVAGKETDPEISYVGTALAECAGVDLAGQRLSQAPADTLISKGLSYYGQVLVKKVPITFGGEFVDRRGIKILYRSIILPLSDNGMDIDRLLGAANCREVTEG